MGRFMRLSGQSFAQNDMFVPPFAYMDEVIKRNQRWADETINAAELIDQTLATIPVAPTDKELFDKINSELKTQIEDVTTAIYNDPTNWREHMGKVKAIGDRVTGEIRNGLLGKIMERASAWEMLQKNIKKLEIQSPKKAELLRRYGMNEFNRAVENPLYVPKIEEISWDYAPEKDQDLLKHLQIMMKNGYTKNVGGRTVYVFNGKEYADVESAIAEVVANNPDFLRTTQEYLLLGDTSWSQPLFKKCIIPREDEKKATEILCANPEHPLFNQIQGLAKIHSDYIVDTRFGNLPPVYKTGGGKPYMRGGYNKAMGRGGGGGSQDDQRKIAPFQTSTKVMADEYGGGGDEITDETLAKAYQESPSNVTSFADLFAHREYMPDITYRTLTSDKTPYEIREAYKRYIDIRNKLSNFLFSLFGEKIFKGEEITQKDLESLSESDKDRLNGFIFAINTTGNNLKEVSKGKENYEDLVLKELGKYDFSTYEEDIRTGFHNKFSVTFKKDNIRNLNNFIKTGKNEVYNYLNENMGGIGYEQGFKEGKFGAEMTMEMMKLPEDIGEGQIMEMLAQVPEEERIIWQRKYNGLVNNYYTAIKSFTSELQKYNDVEVINNEEEIKQIQASCENAQNYKSDEGSAKSLLIGLLDCLKGGDGYNRSFVKRFNLNMYPYGEDMYITIADKENPGVVGRFKLNNFLKQGKDTPLMQAFMSIAPLFGPTSNTYLASQNILTSYTIETLNNIKINLPDAFKPPKSIGSKRYDITNTILQIASPNLQEAMNFKRNNNVAINLVTKKDKQGNPVTTIEFYKDGINVTRELASSIFGDNANPDDAFNYINLSKYPQVFARAIQLFMSNDYSLKEENKETEQPQIPYNKYDARPKK